MKKLVLLFVVLLCVALAWWTQARGRGVAPLARELDEPKPQAAAPRLVGGERDAVRADVVSEPGAPHHEGLASASSEMEESGAKRSLPPASIEGHVSRAGEPVGGGLAWLHRCGKDESPWCVSVQPSMDDLTTPVGLDGTFAFVALEPGVYCAGVEVEPGVVRNQYWPIFERESRRWDIQLEEAEIRGTVRSGDGSPADGACVWFYSNSDDQEAISGSTLTGSDGGYELRGLRAGTFGLRAFLVDDTFDPLDPQVDVLDLGADEVRVVDLGGAHDVATWTARVLTAGGRPLPALSVRLEVKSSEEHTRFEVAPQRDGSFRRELAPGTYLVTLVSGCGSFALGALEMTARAEDSEYRLPGAWVQVSIRHVGAPSSRGTVDQLSVSAARSDSPWQVERACPGDDDTWHFLLAPGEYELWASRGGRRKAVDKRLLVVRPGEDWIEQELVDDR